jgi:hypothetical protein
MLHNVHVVYKYCRYLDESERDRKNQVMMVPCVSDLIISFGTLLHTEWEKPTHPLIFHY